MKDVFGILVYQALCFILESRNGAVRPPLFKVAVFVEQPSYNNNKKSIVIVFLDSRFQEERGRGWGVFEGE